ncbi:MAG: hypothetical protein PHG48_07760 [Eubacteriales bacterium]|nr:hypothetical protein [Eubacteriales bacterium]
MDESIDRLKKSLFVAYKDACIAAENGAIIGAFILASCLIDYLV